MIRANFSVVIDACVLANYAVCDLLLRLAETPTLYLPRWSKEILEETRRTQLCKLKWPEHIVDSFHEKVSSAFPEALVAGYSHLIQECQNEAKDRHVLACAIHCKAEIIVTFNLKDFSDSSLGPWGIRAEHPQAYLLCLYSMEPLIVLHTLESISRRCEKELEDYLIELGYYLPEFCQRVLLDLNKSS